MSSTLTDEQRQRIEQNRLKALEKRKAASTSQQPAPSNTLQINSNSGQNVPSFTQSRASVVGQSQPRFQTPSNTTNYSSFNNQNQRPSYQAGSRPQIAPQKSVAPVITGCCTLISRERFMTEMPFQTQAIAIFKSVKGGRYDPQTKNWTFPLSEHGDLMNKMESLRPNVVIGRLPKLVLKIFGKGTSAPIIPNLSDDEMRPIDPVLLQSLFPFQRQGVCFGISKNGRVLIADDMGLGKTIQALGIAHYYYNDWPLLIVTPSSMRYPWRDSIWQWLPSVPAGAVSVVESNSDPITLAKVIIMSYDILQRRAEEPAVKKCGVIIVDESHLLKNDKTVRSKAAMPLLTSCKRTILLTGTPALSRPIELYNQISACNRQIFPLWDKNDFGIRYCDGKKGAWGWDFKGATNMPELQIVLEETVMIRRLKSKVLTELPSKIRQHVILDPILVKGKTKQMQEKAKAYRDSRTKSGTGTLLEYYAETGSAKIEALKNYITELVESDRKFLCFAHHQVVIKEICGALEKSKCKYIKIEGSTPSEERKRLVEKFQHSEECRVAVLSITAANTGITLTSANLVVFAELYWNPGILIQAEDRAHRIGQMDSVVIQYLVAKGTCDDDLWTMVSNKLDVLSKAGLSKDNFRDANSDALIQQRGHGGQKRIQDYLQPVPSSHKSHGDLQEVKENLPKNDDSLCAQMFDDDTDMARFFDATFDAEVSEESMSALDSSDSVDNLFANIDSQGGIGLKDSKKFKCNQD